MLRAAFKLTSTDLEHVSVAALNVEMEIPDWDAIKRELQRRKTIGVSSAVQAVGARPEAHHGHCTGTAKEDPKEDRSQGASRLGEAVKRTMKSLALPKAKRTKRDIAVKTKTYRKGRIWAGVGVRKDGNRVGKRAHLYDGGYRPFKKGLVRLSEGVAGPKPPPKLVRNWKGNRNARIVPFSQERDWRKGMRRQQATLGARINRRLYITRAGQRHQPRVFQFIYDAVQVALMEGASRA